LPQTPYVQGMDMSRYRTSLLALALLSIVCFSASASLAAVYPVHDKINSELKTYIINVLKEQNNNIEEKFIDDFMFSIKSNEKFTINIDKLYEWKVDYSKKHSKRR
jgi:hypothetical protein